VTGSQAPPPFPRSRPDDSNIPRIDPDRLLAIAAREAPGARPTGLYMDENPVRIPMRYPEDRTPAGRTNIFIDAYSGAVVYHLDSRTGPLGFRIVKLWNREIHTGDILGWPTRIIAAAASLMLPLLAVTGPLVWWNRRRRASGRPGSHVITRPRSPAPT